MTPATDHDLEVLDFLAEFALDRERGTVAPLLDYLRRYPGREEAVAREYLQLVAAPRGDRRDGRVGPYHLIAELGRGGQGAVWLARHAQLGRDVALKVLHADRSPTASAQRFRREALVAARLDHPGLATVFDAGEAEGCAWLAMRYVAGESAAALLARHRGGDGGARCLRLPQLPADAKEGAAITAAVWFVARAARALAFAHAAGVVHRDVKPGNLMVTPDGQPVLVDFGLARDHDSSAACLTQTGELLGTPAYMAPELLSDDVAKPGPPVDLWSLGVVLYELVTGMHPFAAASRQMTQRAIVERDPPSVRRLNPAVPRTLATVLEVALQKAPQRRYRSAAAFAADLELVASGEMPTCRPPGLFLRTVCAARRRPTLAALAAVITAFVVIAFAHLERTSRREADLRAKAIARAGDLRDLSRSLLFDLHGVIRDLPGATAASRDLCSRALDFLQVLRGEMADDPSLLGDVVAAHLQIGDVLGNPRHPNLGQPEAARRHYDDALVLLATATAAPARAVQFAQCRLRLGELAEAAHDLEAAQAHWRTALAGLDGVDPAVAAPVAAVLHLRSAEALAWSGHEREQQQLAATSLAAALECLRACPAGAETTLLEVATHTESARLHLVREQVTAAADEADCADALLQSLPEDRRGHLTFRCLRASLDSTLGTIAWKLGRAADAEQRLQRCDAQLTELATVDPGNEQIVRLRLQNLSTLAFVLLDQERHGDCAAVLGRADALVGSASARFGAEWFTSSQAAVQAQLGQLYYERFDYERAEAALRASMVAREAMARARPDNLQMAGDAALTGLRLARVLVRSQQPDAAESVLADVGSRLDDLVRRDPDRVAWQNTRIAAHQQRGEIAFQRGDYAAAAGHYEHAMAAQDERPAGPERERSLAILGQGLAEAYLQSDRLAAACEQAEAAAARLRTLRAGAPQDRYVARLHATALVGLARLWLQADDARAGATADEAFALTGELDRDEDADTPRLLQTRAMASVVVGAVRFAAGQKDAAAASVAVARATLARLPVEQRRMQYAYEGMLAQLERDLPLR
ncbi:MAG: protein kinase [Planctomycetes bacterium]|nr:protein kinase [Planctomycetota bacterium]